MMISKPWPAPHPRATNQRCFPLLFLGLGTVVWLSLATLHLPQHTLLRALLREWQAFTGIPNDKLLHGVLYFGVCLLLYQFVRHSVERLAAPLWSGILASGLGLLMEILQGALSYYGYAQRAFDLHDAFANLLGAAAATFLLFIRTMRHSTRSNNPKKRHARIFFTRYVISKSTSCAKVLDVTQ